MSDDRDLMARAQKGERSSFDELVRRYHAGVFAFACQALGDRHLADDATQDAFLRAFTYRSSYKPEAGTVRGWLFAIAGNVVRDKRRSRRRTAPLEAASAVHAAKDDWLSVYAKAARCEAVSSALSGLSEQERELIALRYGNDLSYEEIARALGIGESAAKMRTLRARETLARRLAAPVENDAKEER